MEPSGYLKAYKNLKRGRQEYKVYRRLRSFANKGFYKEAFSFVEKEKEYRVEKNFECGTDAVFCGGQMVSAPHGTHEAIGCAHGEIN